MILKLSLMCEISDVPLMALHTVTKLLMDTAAELKPHTEDKFL